MSIKRQFYHVYEAYPSRIPHVEGVRDLAVHWAKKNGLNVPGLEAAAYYHDLTKYEPRRYHEAIFEAHGHPDWKALPEFVMHGYSASLLAEKAGLAGPIIQAIKHHTTGRPAMTMEEKVLMLADKVEPSRPYPEAPLLRAQADEDFEAAFLAMLAYLYLYDQRHDRVNAHSLKTYAYYIPERMAE